MIIQSIHWLIRFALYPKGWFQTLFSFMIRFLVKISVYEVRIFMRIKVESSSRPEAIYHGDIKIEPIDQSESPEENSQPVPDEPETVTMNFMNPLEPTDLSMPRELFSDLSMRTPGGRLYIDNGTRLKCKICHKMCRSKHEFHVHVRSHTPKCAHCGWKFNTWKEFQKHIQSCTRRNGIQRIPKRPVKAKKERRPFKCQLCDRSYLTYAHLFNHQVQRCKKRYLTDAWIVKI